MPNNRHIIGEKGLRSKFQWVIEGLITVEGGSVMFTTCRRPVAAHFTKCSSSIVAEFARIFT